MSLCGGNLYGIADVFPQTSQITSGELLLFFFVNDLFDVLGVAEIRALMSVLSKLTPRCRIEDIFALTLFYATILAQVSLVYVFL